jgi:hypothetical protein
MNTPFLPGLRAALAPLGSRTAQAFKTVRALTLCQLEDRFAGCLPSSLFPKNRAKQNSRHRLYTSSRTFWCLLWQSFNPYASCREVVRQLQALFQLHGGPRISPEDGAYCRARGRLPLSEFPKALAASARAADRAAAALAPLQGRPVKIADGSTLTLPDTPKNRRAYPPLHSREPNFPMLRIVVLFSLLSGAILSVVCADLRTAELPMLAQLMGQLARGDILLADRGFGNFVTLALLHNLHLDLDFIGRSARGVDGRRRLKRLGKNDWLVKWKRSVNPSRWMSLEQWQALPKEQTVRVVRGSLYCKGFRVRQVTLVTTLLDPQQYRAQEILRAYLRRWRLEMCLDDLKTTLEMEMLRSHSPQMVQKEIYARLLVHNLVRWTMAQAAREHTVSLERVSFKGSLDALRQFTQAMSQARSKNKRQQLWSELLWTLANDLLPERPERREPRAVKRVRNKYPRLSVSRHKFHDRPKRSVRRTISRLRELGLK